MDIIVYKLFLFPPRCIKLQFGGEEAQNEAWSWLAANQLSTVVNTKESRLVVCSGSSPCLFIIIFPATSIVLTGSGGRTLFQTPFFSPPHVSFVCLLAPPTRPGACWPPTWTGIPPPTLSNTATSSTSCCHMTSHCPTGWSSRTRWETLLLLSFQPFV